jgi:hypothetical protein
MLKNWKFSLLHILLCAFILRAFLALMALWLAGSWEVFYRGDSLDYVNVAREMLAHGTFTTHHGEPYMIRTPGYPLLILPTLLVSPYEGALIFIQILLSCATVYVVYHIGFLLTQQRKMALTGALLMALEPLSIVFSTLILTETLFTLLVSVLVLVCVRYLRMHTHGIKECVWIAGVLIALIYVRPAGLYLPLVVAGIMIATGIMHKEKHVILHAGIIVLVTYVVVGAWIVRNGMHTGDYTFSTISKVNISANAFKVLEEAHGKPLQSLYQTYQNRPETILDSRLSVDFDALKHGRYMEIFLRYFWVSAKVYATGLVSIFIGGGGTDYFRLFNIQSNNTALMQSITNGFQEFGAHLSSSIPALIINGVLVGYIVICYGLVGGCALKTPPITIRRVEMWLVLLIIAYFVAISGGVFGYSRFRLPIMPLVCVFAGMGAMGLCGWIKAKSAA